MMILNNDSQHNIPALQGRANKYDMVGTLCFWLVNHNDSSRWFAISSSHLFAVPVSVLLVSRKKKKD